MNEGFASYVEYMGVDHVHEDWLMVRFKCHDIYIRMSILMCIMWEILVTYLIYLNYNIIDGSFRNRVNIQYKKTADLVLLRLFIKN